MTFNSNVLCIANELNHVQDVAIVFHKNPDGDAIGSAVALFLAFRQLGKNCKILTFSEISSRFNFLPLSGCASKNFQFKHVVAVDLATKALLEPELKHIKIDLVIDHHKNNDVDSKLKLIDENACATCEIIYFLLKHMNITISEELATCLYVGVATDTGCFKFENATSRAHLVAANLINFGINYAQINFRLFDQKTVAQLKLQGVALKNLKLFCNGRCAIVFVSRQNMIDCGCADSDFFVAVDVVRSVCGVVVAIAIKEVDVDVFKASVRTLKGFSACEFCAQFEGGGHERAAGFEIKGSKLVVESKILNRVEKLFEGHNLHQ